MTSRINNPECCICCGRRSDGVAVGTPKKLGWFCKECGPDMAKQALLTHTREFDAVEKRAAKAVADLAGGAIEVPAEESPAFVLWVVENFALNMRQQFDSGQPPF